MMMGCPMVLCKVVGVVVFALFPVDLELILLRAAADPIKRMSTALDRHCLTVSLAQCRRR
jgi:hypothetical protein